MTLHVEYWCENCHAFLGSREIKRCPRCHSKDIEKESDREDEYYYMERENGKDD